MAHIDMTKESPYILVCFCVQAFISSPLSSCGELQVTFIPLLLSIFLTYIFSKEKENHHKSLRTLHLNFVF